MIIKILTENNKIIVNVFFETSTNQAHLNSCTYCITYLHNIIEYYSYYL
jgi:hypothetical protein